MDDLYGKVCRWDNLWLAWRRAAKGKRGRARRRGVSPSPLGERAGVRGNC